MHSSISPHLSFSNPMSPISLPAAIASSWKLEPVTHNFKENPTNYLQSMSECYIQLMQTMGKHPHRYSVECLNQVVFSQLNRATILEQLSKLAADQQTEAACLKARQKLLDEAQQVNHLVLTHSPFNVDSRYAYHLLNPLDINGFIHFESVTNWFRDLVEACNPQLENGRIPWLLSRVNAITAAWKWAIEQHYIDKEVCQEISLTLVQVILAVAYQMPSQAEKTIDECAQRTDEVLNYAMRCSEQEISLDGTHLHAKHFWLGIADQESQIVKKLNPSLYPLFKARCLEIGGYSARFSYLRSLVRGMSAHIENECLSQKKDLYITIMLPRLLLVGKMNESTLKEQLQAGHHDVMQHELAIDGVEHEQIIKECLNSCQNITENAHYINVCVQAALSHFLLKKTQGKHAPVVVSLKPSILECEQFCWHPAYLRALSRKVTLEKMVTAESAYRILDHLAQRWLQIAWLSFREQEQMARAIFRELANLFPPSFHYLECIDETKFSLLINPDPSSPFDLERESLF